MSIKIATTVGQYLHRKICRHYSISTTSNWYEYYTEPVTDGQDVSILWYFPMHTDRTIQANRPDIVIKDKMNTICHIDITVPSDNNDVHR